MDMSYQRNWPMTNEYYSQDAMDYSPYQPQEPNNYYVGQLPYTSFQPQTNIHQVYNQVNLSTGSPNYVMDYQQQQQYEQQQQHELRQQHLQLAATNNRKARTSISKSIKRQRQLRRNERERERQGRLNSAFDVLRGSIPSFLAPYKHEQKLTQIETLRLAKYYISSLKGMLDENDADSCESDDESEGSSKIGKLRTDSSSSSDASL